MPQVSSRVGVLALHFGYMGWRKAVQQRLGRHYVFLTAGRQNHYDFLTAIPGSSHLHSAGYLPVFQVRPPQSRPVKSGTLRPC